MALTQKQQLWSKEWEFHWKKTYSLRKDSVHRLLDTRLLHSMGPGQGWKHHNYSKTQLPTSRTDPKQFCLGCFSQHNTQQRQQATEFPGRQLMEGSTMNEKKMFSPAKFSLFQVCIPEMTCHLLHFLIQTQKWRHCHETRLCFPCFLWA